MGNAPVPSFEFGYILPADKINLPVIIPDTRKLPSLHELLYI